MDYILAILIGVGLSISAGFRVFTPMLLASIAAKVGWLPLAAGFEWLGSNVALTALALATLLEVISYYVPVFDNFMRGLATPLAAVAGTLMTVAVIGTENAEFLSWGLAFVTGGGAATLTSLTNTAIRGTSTVTTAGVGNPAVSIVEDLSAIVLPIISIAVPVMVVVLLVIIIWLFVKFFNRVKR
ncbi:MAG: DUF4126 domain-containing protein [Caryophanon sp.]|nr:DUF4126 domain-containing protein [Caryophanon sp.]